MFIVIQLFGGRGSSSDKYEDNISVTKANNKPSPAIDVSGYTPDIGHRTVSLKKTLNFIEDEKMKGLSHEQLFIIKDGYVIHGYDGKKGSVCMDSNGYADVKGCVVTHNHPRSGREKGMVGGTFSLADIKCLSTQQPSEMRAVANEAIYSIKPKSNADPIRLEKAFAANRQRIVKKYQENARAIIEKKNPKMTPKEIDTICFNNRMKYQNKWLEDYTQNYGYEYTMYKKY